MNDPNDFEYDYDDEEEGAEYDPGPPSSGYTAWRDSQWED